MLSLTYKPNAQSRSHMPESSAHIRSYLNKGSIVSMASSTIFNSPWPSHFHRHHSFVTTTVKTIVGIVRFPWHGYPTIQRKRNTFDPDFAGLNLHPPNIPQVHIPQTLCSSPTPVYPPATVRSFMESKVGFE